MIHCPSHRVALTHPVYQGRVNGVMERLTNGTILLARSTILFL